MQRVRTKGLRNHSQVSVSPDGCTLPSSYEHPLMFSIRLKRADRGSLRLTLTLYCECSPWTGASTLLAGCSEGPGPANRHQAGPEVASQRPAWKAEGKFAEGP